MKLIIGGSHQGKKAYASTAYHLPSEAWADGQTCSLEAVFTMPAIHNFHLYLRRCLADGENLSALPGEIMMKNPHVVIVTDEVGYGIVPMEREERIWREACGRVCTALAAEAEQVVRVCCGIGQKLK